MQDEYEYHDTLAKIAQENQENELTMPRLEADLNMTLLEAYVNVDDYSEGARVGIIRDHFIKAYDQLIVGSDFSLFLNAIKFLVCRVKSK